MDRHTFKVLEYDGVIEKIAVKTTNAYGRRVVEGRMPQKDLDGIHLLQAETNEAADILNSKEPFIVGELGEVEPALQRSKKGAALQPGEILQIGEVASRSASLQKYLNNREALYPRLYQASRILTSFPRLEKVITSAIGGDGNILDSASSSLEAIRRSLEVLQNRIRGQLEQFLKNPEYAKMLQEPIITSREHRHVLPVRQEFRAQFPGIALDSSASGATVFMEPLTVLKLTNELKYQKSEEEREEERIRLKISKEIAAAADDMARNLEFLGHFDALQASARYMVEVNGVIPQVVREPLLDLYSARHPLLPGKAVPIDIHIGIDFSGLIVTGPNTGGKTVSLKTSGLLALMALAGLPVPASEGSRVGLFTGLYADIGDEQSISQSLSTFSAHIKNIAQILPRAGRRTLVLLDEIGAGTDPSEGVAIGSNILKFLVERGSQVIATTHYNELKVFASKDPRFKNAAVEFDEETLMPTYRVQIGLPGRSCAVKIARRLGMPEEILGSAEESLGQSYQKMETLLTEIDQEKSRAQKERRDAEEDRRQMEALREEYDRKILEIETQRDEILQSATRDADGAIQEVLQDLRDARQEWRKSMKDHKEGKKDRLEVKENEKMVRTLLNDTISRLKKIQEDTHAPGAESPAFPFQPGQLVNVTTTGRRGRVDRILDNFSALVDVGSVRMEIPMAHLEPVDVDFSDLPQPVQDLRLKKVLSISDQLDLRGHRVDEGLSALEKYVDDACLANLDSFRIIHGKGTGALRDAVQQYLRSCPVVKGFREGELHEGGWGVTVVNL